MLDKAWFTVHLSTWYSSHLVLNCHVFTERCSDLTSKGERSNHIWYLTAAKSATKSGKLFCGKIIHTPTPSKLDRGAELCSAAIKNFVTMLIWIVENLKIKTEKSFSPIGCEIKVCNKIRFCGKMIHTPTPSKLDRGAEKQSFAPQLLRTLSSYSYELFKTYWNKQLLNNEKKVFSYKYPNWQLLVA